jgi:hypothetical protein
MPRAARDLAVFSIGTMPDGAKARLRAQDLAVRLAGLLGGQRMPDAQAGEALGVHPNSLRYAAQKVQPWRPLSRAERAAVEAEAGSLPLPGRPGRLTVRWED